MNYWLLKTEPAEYSFWDLKKEKTTRWDGIKAPAALQNLRLMKKGDRVLIYHTGREKAIVGTGLVVIEAYPDPGQEDSRRLVLNISAGEALKRPVKLSEIKQSGLFPEWQLIRQPRLSVVPVSREQWDKLTTWDK